MVTAARQFLGDIYNREVAHIKSQPYDFKKELQMMTLVDMPIIRADILQDLPIIEEM